MRVAFTTLAPFISGAERSLQVTLRALPAAGVEPVVIGPPDNALAPWCQASGIPFLACPLPQRDKRHPLRWFAGVRRVRALLRRHRIDLVHANQVWSYPAAAAAARSLGLPRVCHMRDEVGPEAVRWFCRAGVEAVLCISRHIEQLVSPAWPPGTGRPLIRTLLNPVRLPELPGAAEQAALRHQARRSLGADPDATVFGFIGQMVPVKGLQVLLDALAGLADRPGWQLLVAGRDPNPGAPHEKLCAEQVARLGLSGRVRFLGFLDNPDTFYQAIDLAVVPSLAEPLGRIPLEAAAFARPALAFAVGGLPDTIRHGETGWLIPPECDALRQNLAAYLLDPRPETGLAARAWVERASDPRHYAARLADLYRELLAGRPSTPAPRLRPPEQHREPAGPALLLSEVFPPRTGGSGRWFWEIYSRLPRDGYFVVAGEHPRQEEFDSTHDLRLERLPLTLPSWGLRSVGALRGYGRAIRRLRALARRERVGMVHCGRCLPEGVMALALRLWAGTPYLCYAHGEELNYAASSRELSWLMRRVLDRAEYVIANSRNTLRLMRDEWRVPAERLRLLHPGVDTSRFVPAPPDAEVRRTLGWGDRPVVLTVGRLQKRKGHDTMIRALPAIRRTVPDILYSIVGDGEERRPLEELVAAHGLAGHVQFLGEIDDDSMVRCYQQCDLFVLANRQVGQDIEGFGMVLLEAQACGKAVVAGASGGTAETMSVPETGRIVPCEESGELAALIAELLGDRPRLGRMGDAARHWVVRRFDWFVLAAQAGRIFAGEASADEPSHSSAIPEET